MLPHPRSISPYFALAAIVLGPQTVGCRALLDDGPNRVPTDLTVWLEQTVVDDKEGGIFNRLRLIKAVANLGGGTHFSPDIRAYFAKLQDMGVTASRNGTTVRQTFVDVEKHSLRQIAHEVLASFDDRYRRLGQFEPGTLMIGPPSTVLYPGRKMQLAPIVKLKAGPAVMLKLPPHGFTDLRTSAVKLPYEETSAKSPCPCGSGLRFKACCSEARDFPPSFIEKFERQYSLGEFDVKTLS